MATQQKTSTKKGTVGERETMSNTSGHMSFTWIHWTGKHSKEFWERGKLWRDLAFLMFMMLMCRLSIKKIYIYVKLFFSATSSTWRLGTVWVLRIKYFQHCYFSLLSTSHLLLSPHTEVTGIFPQIKAWRQKIS